MMLTAGIEADDGKSYRPPAGGSAGAGAPDVAGGSGVGGAAAIAGACGMNGGGCVTAADGWVVTSGACGTTTFACGVPAGADEPASVLTVTPPGFQASACTLT